MGYAFSLLDQAVLSRRYAGSSASEWARLFGLALREVLLIFARFVPASDGYAEPLGISRGALRLFVIARKIAVSLVKFWFDGTVAWHPSPSSE